MSNGYRYVGHGETYRSLPPRDLTQEEYDDLPLLEQRAVTESGAYEPIPDKKQKGKPTGDATAPTPDATQPAETQGGEEVPHEQESGDTAPTPDDKEGTN